MIYAHMQAVGMVNDHLSTVSDTATFGGSASAAIEADPTGEV